MPVIETDYLVVGAGAAGLAFTDELVARSPHHVVLVDRRHGPGGHWLDAYPFVRLHQPSAHYGVSSRRLGNDAIDASGTYERATAPEICDYFGRVLDEQLLPTGRVRFLGLHDYLPGDDGAHRVVSRLTGEPYDVVVRRKVVDAAYMEAGVPATHRPSFAVAPGVACVPVNGLASVGRPFGRYVILGAGKTAMDACGWLLDHGVPPDRLTWVRPRDAWVIDRRSFQPMDLMHLSLEGFALELEALAGAESLADLFRRLEERGRVYRLDPAVEPAMYHCATVDERELEQLRSIRDVVRLGRVVRIEPDELVLTEGSLPSDPDRLYVDCTAAGLRRSPARPVFSDGRVTLQYVRQCSPTFNAALVGFVEATRDDPEEQNRLCPPNPPPDTPRDWVRVLLTTMKANRAWAAAPDLMAWLEETRLNLYRGLPGRLADPRVQQAAMAVGATAGPAIARGRELLAAEAEPAAPVPA